MGNLPLKGSRFEIICSDQYSTYFLETREGETKHYLYAGQNLLIFPDSGFSSAVLLHVTGASQENDWI